MKLTTFKDITYRDMSYKMVMTNASGDTAYLYDMHNHMSVMTPFTYDEEKIDNPEFLASLQELTDNFIHGDLHQNENYEKLIEENIEQLGELELEDEERLYLTEIISTWAKRSKYVQQFEKEFDKIGIDISNILYEIDPEYNDLIDSCKKSEEKNLEKLKEEESVEIKESDSPEGLEEIDPEMQEEVKREMNESNSNETRNDTVENDNKEIENPNLEETTNDSPNGDNSTSATASTEEQEVAVNAPVKEIKSEDLKEEQSQKTTDPVSTVTTNPVVLNSEYELIQPYIKPIAELLNSAWISLVFYDVKRSDDLKNKFYERLTYAADKSVTPDECKYVIDVINEWKNTGGVCLKDQVELDAIIASVQNKMNKPTNNLADDIFKRDVTLIYDSAQRWASDLDGDKKNDHINYISNDYREIIKSIKSADSKISKESIEYARQLSSELLKKISGTKTEEVPEAEATEFVIKFNRTRFVIEQFLEMAGKQGLKEDEIDYLEWEIDRLKRKCSQLPEGLSNYDKSNIEGFIPAVEKYIKQFKKQSMDNPELLEFMSKYKRAKSYLEEYEYYRKSKGIDTNRIDELRSYAISARSALEGCTRYISRENYQKYYDELNSIVKYSYNEEEVANEFSSMARRF